MTVACIRSLPGCYIPFTIFHEAIVVLGVVDARSFCLDLLISLPISRLGGDSRIGLTGTGKYETENNYHQEVTLPPPIRSVESTLIPACININIFTIN